MRSALTVTIALLLLSGCSWFGDKEDDSTKPAELTPIKQEIELVSLWKKSIGGTPRDRASRLVPVLSGGRVFAASADGNIAAMEPGTGRLIWEVKVESFYTSDDRKNAFAKKSDAITGGVGVAGDLILVGTFAGEIVALNQSDGSLAWRARTTSEVLAPPRGDTALLIAQSIDRKVAAFDALDGTRRWVYSTSVPSLTLRGTSTPIVTSEFVAAGFANGRVILFDRERGLAGVDRRIASPQGKSDLERLVDIDGQMVFTGETLLVVSYQGNLAALDIKTGQERWSIAASSSAGLAAGFGNVYVAQADGRLTAYEESTSKQVWENTALAYRELSTPASISSYVAVGDYDGYLHLIAQSDGRFVGRRKIDGDALRAPAVVDGSRLYIMTGNGRLEAFELR